MIQADATSWSRRAAGAYGLMLPSVVLAMLLNPWVVRNAWWLVTRTLKVINHAGTSSVIIWVYTWQRGACGSPGDAQTPPEPRLSRKEDVESDGPAEAEPSDAEH